jgi:hypothetical protein
MLATRVVEPETLDGLDADDPAARRSRRDLRRIHRAMGTGRLLRGQLRAVLPPLDRMDAPLRVLELGAGDGTLLVGIAETLGRDWPPVALTLLDRQALVAPETRTAYARCGWSVVQHTGEVSDWAADVLRRHAAPAPSARAVPATPSPPPWNVVVANLFLHHFEGAALASLLRAVAACSERFVALEPRRSGLALAASRLVGVIGANAVTREDAVLSVRAGFSGAELGSVWRSVAGDEWQLDESSAGLFSHAFRAVRAAPDGGRR